MEKGTLAKFPKDAGLIRLRHAVIVPLIFLALGPGCGALAGSFYGATKAGAIFGAVAMAVGIGVALPSILVRGARRGG
jgi:hypothetical protein